MQKSIRKPRNWQDFETLCKRLWSEYLWNDFKKHGRNWQKQDGVDIYGIPEGKSAYWWIQCKLKTEEKNLTNEEIATEIACAERFEPELGQLIIASTMTKDVALEKFIRLTNAERKKCGKFWVDLYCWEDIEGLLEENYHTYQWYIQNLDVTRSYWVWVTFSDDNQEIILHPKWARTRKKYVLVLPSPAKTIQDAMWQIGPIYPFWFSRKTNHGWNDFEVIFKNCWGWALRHWKLRFSIDPKDGVFSDESEQDILFKLYPDKWKTEWDDQVLYSDPNDRPFIQNDKYFIRLSLRPNIGTEKISIFWELLAEDFSDNWILDFIIEPEIVDVEEIVKASSLEELDRIKSRDSDNEDWIIGYFWE